MIAFLAAYVIVLTAGVYVAIMRATSAQRSTRRRDAEWDRFLRVARALGYHDKEKAA